MMRAWFLLPLIVMTGCERPVDKRPLTVFAAASMTDVITQLAQRYEQTQGIKVQCSFAATSMLAKQIEAGAPADIFVAAQEQWMDYLAQRHAIEPHTRLTLAANELVVIVPKDAGGNDSLDDGRIAMGDPDHVPAGTYAKQSLTKLGLWEGVKPRVLAAEDVRAAMHYVEAGEAAAAIVYATDARLSGKVKVAMILPSHSHDPITYPAAVVRGAKSGSNEFLQFLAGAEAAAVLRDAGFTKPR